MNTFLGSVVSNVCLVCGLGLVLAGVQKWILRADVRHLLWLLLLIKLLTPPVWNPTFAWLTTAASPPEWIDVGDSPETRAPSDAASIEPPPAMPEHFKEPFPPPAAVSPVPVSPVSREAAAWGLPSVSMILLAAWILGMVACLGIAIRRHARFQNLLRLAESAGTDVQLAVSMLAERISLRRVPEVVCLPARIPPALWGWPGRSLIVLPAHLINDLNENEREAVLLHELIHFSRRDHWTRLLELAVTTLYWWLPASWWMRTQLRQAEEDSCDDRLLGTLPHLRRAYAEALVKTAGFLSQGPVIQAATGFGSYGELEQRVRRIMTGPAPGTTSRRLRGLILLASVILLPCAPLLIRAQDQASPVDPSIVRLSADGDPLPRGVLAQLGTRRLRHPGWHGRIHFLPDSRTLVSTSEDNTARFWDIPTGKLKTSFQFQDMHVRGSVLMPDGKSLAAYGFWFDETTVSSIKVVRIALLDGTLLHSITWPEQGEIGCLTVTPDGKRLVLGDSQGKITIREIATGQVTHVQDVGQRSEIRAVSVSPDGKLIASGGQGGNFLWEWQAEGQPKKLEPEGRAAQAFAFSPDGTMLLGGRDTVAPQLWDVHSRKLIADFPSSEGRYFPDILSFTSDGKGFVIAEEGMGRPGSVQIWDVATRTLRKKLDCGSLAARNAIVSPDGKWLAASGFDTVICVWNLETGERVETVAGHEQSALSVAVDSTGSLVLTGSDDNTARAWDAGTGAQRLQLPHAHWVRSVAISPDGKLFATNRLGEGSGVRIYEASTGRLLHEFKTHGRHGGRRAVRFSPAGDRLYSWGDDMFIRIWNVQTGALESEVSHRQGTVSNIPAPYYGNEQSEIFDLVREGEFSLDGSQLFLIYRDRVSIIDSRTGKEARCLPFERLRDGAISPDGRTLAVLTNGPQREFPLKTGGFRSAESEDFELEIRDLESGQQRFTIKLERGEWGRQMVFSSDSQLMALCRPGEDRRIDVFGIDPNQQRYRYRIQGFDTDVARLAFMADGRRLVSTHADGTGLIWDLATFRLQGPRAQGRADDSLLPGTHAFQDADNEGGLHRGKVMDDAARPVAAVTVEAYLNWRKWPDSIVTDERGEFEFPAGWLPTLENGRRGLSFLIQDGEKRIGWRQLKAEDKAPENGSTLEIRLWERSREVSGKFVDEKGNPLAGVVPVIEAIWHPGDSQSEIHLSGETWKFPPSDESGRYVMRVPENCSFSMKPHHPDRIRGRINVKPDQTQLNEQMLLPAGGIQGTVVNRATGAPLANRPVAAQAIDPNSLGDEFSRSAMYQSMFTDATGRYELRGLPPGDYNVLFSGHDEPGHLVAPAHDGVLVRAGGLVKADFQASPGVRLFGRVLSPDGKSQPAISVGYYGAAFPESGAAADMVKTGPDGVFEFWVPPGDARIYVAVLGPPVADGSREFTVPAQQEFGPKDLFHVPGERGAGPFAGPPNSDVASEAPVQKPPAISDAARKAPAQKPPAISLNLQAPLGKPVRGALVHQFRETSQHSFGSGIVSGSRGNISIGTDDLNRNLVLVIDAPGFRKAVVHVDALGEQRQREVTATLVPETPLPVRGRVLDATGQPVKGARLRVRRVLYREEVQFPYGKEATTGPDGAFLIDHLLPGDRFQLELDNTFGLRGRFEWYELQELEELVIPDFVLGN